MRVAIYNSKRFGAEEIQKLGTENHQFLFLEEELTQDSIHHSVGYEVVCGCPAIGRHKDLMVTMAEIGTRYFLLGNEPNDEWDFQLARRLGITMAFIPARSPEAVAEHSVALMLSLCRHLIEANQRITAGNFSRKGLRGFDMNSQTVGILGLGSVGKVAARILHGFGASLLAWEKAPDLPFARRYQIYFAEWDIILSRSTVLTVHLPLNSQTHGLIDGNALGKLPRGAMLIHSSRPEILDLEAVEVALDSGQLGFFGWDLFPEEKTCTQHDLVYEGPDFEQVIRLSQRPNVLITHRQGVLTDAAQKHRAAYTLNYLRQWQRAKAADEEITAAG
ncbi:MAG: hypothetical protein NWR72_03440 [Bacteroidia bacterium]|nr:hypothetical protein [Bacteroidia bacterium]